MAGGNRAVQRLCSIIARQVRTYSAPADRLIPPNKQKYVPTEGTYPKGFRVGAAHAGVKKSNTRFDDIALVVSDSSCHAAAVMTSNAFQAAPVVLTRNILRKTGECRSIVVNSGCANAVTGQQGMEDAEAMSKETDRLLFGDNLPRNAPQTLVMSTGVIGQKLPMDRILPAIPKAYEALGSTHDHWLRAAQAICTTDTFPKLISREFTLPSHPETKYSIAGMTKGAGMIHPNMGTLLGIICTDVKIANEAPDTMRQLLLRANGASFNSISIDGDTSTNDTVALFANGAAAPQDVPGIHWKVGEDDDDSIAFRHVLQQFMTELAQLVVRDGEGATKFVTIRVQSDRSRRTAQRVAESIARSSLVKTALYGKDANWGRILCAIGYAPGVMHSYTVRLSNDRRLDPHVVPKRTSVSFIPADGSEELKLLTRGEPENVDEERAKQILEMEDLEISVRLEDDAPDEPEKSKDEGKHKDRTIHEAIYWTCDLSHEYVTINGDYRT